MEGSVENEFLQLAVNLQEKFHSLEITGNNKEIKEGTRRGKYNFLNGEHNFISEVQGISRTLIVGVRQIICLEAHAYPFQINEAAVILV